MPTSSREIHLVARPVGAAQATDFQMVDVELPDPGPDEVLVRTIAMSVPLATSARNGQLAASDDQ